LPNQDKYLDDFRVGDVAYSKPIEVTKDEIIAFGRAYDPQPAHTDPAAAAAGPFGGLVASGLLTTALVLREPVEAGRYGHVPIVGLGIDRLEWLQPVRPGDRLTIRWEVIEVKASATKPDRGVVRLHAAAANQRGETVLTMVTAIVVPKRV